MQKTQIVYKGKKPDLTELKELMPHLDITLTRFLPEDIKTVLDPIYKIQTVDWDWFRQQFSPDNDVNAFVFEKTDLKGVGVTGHWGFYSLDEDLDHHFYMTDIGTKLDKRAKANGFKSNFTWMFCHEYLHGAVWGETRNRQLSAQLVHDWEEQGVLKAKIAEDLERYNTRLKTKNLLETIVGLYKRLLSFNSKTGCLPRVERGIKAVLNEMELLGYPMRVTEGYRTFERQDQLYAQGRTTSGSIVTNAKGGESMHNYRVACDFVFLKEGYNATQNLWETFGAVGKKHGFEWGGSEAWRKAGLVDFPHLQLTLGYSLSDFQKGKVDYSKFS